MRRLSRDAWLLIGLSLTLIVLTVMAVISQTQDLKLPPLSAESSQEDGARALRLWLEELGYRVVAEPQRRFRVPEEAAVAMMLQPTVIVTEQELGQIEDWIRQGGTFILAGLSPASLRVAQYFDFDLKFDPGLQDGLAAQTPLLNSPPQQDAAQGNFQASWLSQDNDYFVLFAEQDKPLIVSSELDDGLLILSTSAFAFSNEGLKEPGNGQLVLNLISAGGPPDQVWFDEWHHGLQAGPPAVAGPVDWLRQTPAGRALLYAMLVILGSLALSGRSFGRPLILPEQRGRRRPIEYITAIANLGRRAGHRQTVLADYHYRIKRGLGFRYRLDPSLPDDEFVLRLGALDAAIDTLTLADLLTRLQKSQLSEVQMVQLAKEASEWIKES